MEYEAECCITLAQLLEAPDRAFAAHLALATDPAVMPPAAAGQVALFAERVSDLSFEERQELFVETFAASSADAERCRIITALRKAPSATLDAAFGASIDRLRTALLNDRNPYGHLLVAIGVLRAVVDGIRAE